TSRPTWRFLRSRQPPLSTPRPSLWSRRVALAGCVRGEAGLHRRSLQRFRFAPASRSDPGEAPDGSSRPREEPSRLCPSLLLLDYLTCVSDESARRLAPLRPDHDLRPQPEPRTTETEVHRGAWHVRVSPLVGAHTLEVTQSQDPRDL